MRLTGLGAGGSRSARLRSRPKSQGNAEPRTAASREVMAWKRVPRHPRLLNPCSLTFRSLPPPALAGQPSLPAVAGAQGPPRVAAGALPGGRSSVRHASRAGGDAAGVAEEAARHVPARADAQARHRPLGRADARVQRGPGLLVDHRAGDVRRAPPHDLRVLRQVRGRRHARRQRRASSGSRSAARRRAACSTRARRPRASPTRSTAGRPSCGATSSGCCSRRSSRSGSRR